MAEKPLVFIIDIDGTMIGDIRPQITLYELNLAIKKHDKHVNVMNFKDFQYKLKHGGIVRPYFAKFVKKIKETIPTAEFFLYTASECKWARFLVPHIEKAIGIKFNRPIFTRANCIIDNKSDIKKALCNITPSVLRALKKKYGELKKHDLMNRMLAIDNTYDVFDETDQKYVIHCPSYDYKYPENIPMYVTQSVFDKYLTVITDSMERLINMKPVKNYMEFLHLFYSYYVNMLSRLYHHNQNQLKDKYFLYLLNIIIYKRITSFPPATVAYLERKLKDKHNTRLK